MFQKNTVTPLTVGMALASHQANRARSEVDTLNDMQLAISYDEVHRTTTRMSLAIMDDIKDNTQSVHIRESDICMKLTTLTWEVMLVHFTVQT